MKSFLLLLLLVFTSTVEAQPGQLYFPPGEYYYTITEESGEAIQFSKNRKYRICIDDVWFHSDSIPTYPKPRSQEGEFLDSSILVDLDLVRSPMSTYGEPNPNHYVHINDFYLVLNHPPSIIKIAHEKDTMFLFQQSQIAKELRLVPGYHYFPRWSAHALSGFPQLSGGEFVNIEQDHFTISKADYDSLHLESRQSQYSNAQRIDNKIADKFIKGYAEIEYDYRPMEFMQDVHPYEGGHFESQLFPTAEENVFMAMIEYSRSVNNCTGYKDFFTRIDFNKNEIEHWFPLDNPQLFGSSARFFKVDTFNQVIHLRVFYRTDTIRPIRECASWAEYKNVMYKSFDDGKHWKEDEKFTELFNEHEFYKFEFLDEHYAMGYKFQKIKHKKKKHQIDQGVFYLLKDGEIVETFLTPEDIAFNSVYANYHFNKGLGDTVFLGSWGYNPYNYRESEPFHIYAVKKNSTWKFEVGSDGFKRSQFYREKEIKTDYENFKISGDTLFFENGAKMANQVQITENPLASGMLILEEGDQIYLINTTNNYMYISFDGGATWLFNPRSLGGRERKMLLKIDTDHKISFFNRKEFAQESYRFKPIE